MGSLLAISNRIDKFTDHVGHVISWLTLFMVLISAFNAVARYGSRFIGINLSSNAFLELQWQAFSIVFLLGGAYALKCGAHVRVDVLYGSLSDRVRAMINLVGTIIFLLPFCLLMLWVTWPMVVNSWTVRETSPNPDGLPFYPIKSFILLAFFLLLLQAISEIIKHTAVLRGELSSEVEEQATPSEGL